MSALIVGLSIREFASKDGCDESLVRRAIKNGRLTALSNGKLDPALLGTGWRRSSRHPAAKPESAADSADTRPVRTEIADTPKAPIVDPETFEAAEEFIRQVLAGNFASMADAERIKENGLALKHILDGQQKAGMLIPLQSAQDAFFKAARDIRDAWTGWVARIAVTAAAELEVDARQFTEVLNRYVHQHLTELGAPEFDPV